MMEDPRLFSRLDHVSIGVMDMDKARRLLCDVFGASPLKDKGSSQGEAFSWETFLLGGKKVELVTPHAPGEGGVGRFLAKRGEGYHHLSFSVADLAAARAHLEANGLRILGLSEEGSWKHFYIHPADTFGALIQVFEETQHTQELAE